MANSNAEFTDNQIEKIANIVDGIAYLDVDEDVKEYGATDEHSITIETGNGNWFATKIRTVPEGYVKFTLEVFDGSMIRAEDFAEFQKKLREEVNKETSNEEYSKEEIMEAFEEAKQEIANRHAAVFQSNLTGVDKNVDLFVAEYGDKVGVNGEEMNTDSYSDPDGYTLLEDHEFSYEEEVDGEVLEKTYINLDADFSNDRIQEVIEDEVGNLEGKTFSVEVTGRHRLYSKVDR